MTSKTTKKKASKASVEKWGKQTMKTGFSIVPSLLLKAQARLKISNNQLAVLMHLVDFWWEAERKPHPSKKTLAERMGVSSRQAQRYAAELEEQGYVERIERKAQDKGKLSNTYDLSGLVDRLNEIAPEFIEVEEKVKKARRNVTRPGLRNRIPTLE